MGRTRLLMKRWWDDYDLEALDLLIQAQALRSGTRTLNNVVGAYGEYLAWKALGGVRLAQASADGDIKLSRGRVIEVKSTTSLRGWSLGYVPPRKNGYALIRFDGDWRVREAWLVPLAVARRHATGPYYRLKANGPWCTRARRLPLNRY